MKKILWGMLASHSFMARRKTCLSGGGQCMCYRYGVEATPIVPNEVPE